MPTTKIETRDTRMPLSWLAGGLALGAAIAFAVPGFAQDTTLTYIASQGWITDGELELAKKFEEETGIHIDYQIIPADQYINVLKARLNSGEGPDIFGGQSGLSEILSYNVVENAVDLSNEPWAANLDPFVAAEASVDGKLYGLTYWDTLGRPWPINYNEQIFAEHGLAEPTTYEEFKNICTTLLAAGIQPMYEPVADGWHHVILWAHLGPRFEELTPGLYAALNANEAKFEGNEAMATALNQIKEFYDLGCFGQTALADTGSGATEAFTSGKVAMLLSTLDFPAAVKNDFPDYDVENIGAFLAPFADNQILDVNPAGPTKYIYSKSPHIAEAKMYFEFLTRPETMTAYMQHPSGPANLPFSNAEGQLPPSQQEYLEEHDDKKGVVLQTAVTYVNPQWFDIGKDMVAMFTGSMDAETLLRNLDRRRADLARAARDPAWQ